MVFADLFDDLKYVSRRCFLRSPVIVQMILVLALLPVGIILFILAAVFYWLTSFGLWIREVVFRERRRERMEEERYRDFPELSPEEEKIRRNHPNAGIGDPPLSRSKQEVKRFLNRGEYWKVVEAEVEAEDLEILKRHGIQVGLYPKDYDGIVYPPGLRPKLELWRMLVREEYWMLTEAELSSRTLKRLATKSIRVGLPYEYYHPLD